MRKNLTRIVAATMMTVILAGTGNKLVSANNDYNGNYIDKPIKLYYNGDGGDVCTGKATKYNNTPTYVYNTGINFRVKVIKQVKGKDLSAHENYERIERGVKKFIYTNAVANNSVYLRISPETHSACTITGYWSPDSINYPKKYK